MDSPEWDPEALVVADDMYTDVFDEGKAARLVPDDDKAEQVRELIRATTLAQGRRSVAAPSSTGRTVPRRPADR